MSKKLKMLFTVLEIVGGLGTIGTTGFVMVEKAKELTTLNESKNVSSEAPVSEVKEA